MKRRGGNEGDVFMLTEVHHLGRVPAGKRYRYLQILEAADVVEARLREEIAQGVQGTGTPSPPAQSYLPRPQRVSTGIKRVNRPPPRKVCTGKNPSDVCRRTRRHRSNPGSINVEVLVECEVPDSDR